MGSIYRDISVCKGRDLHLNGTDSSLRGRVCRELLWPAEGQSALSTAGELMGTRDLLVVPASGLPPEG